MVARTTSEEAQIPQFYTGRSVLITGATGFMGKVLVERLLSTCPGVGRLLLLMRHKKNVSPEARLEQLKQSEVFDVLRQKNPGQLDKLVALTGDAALPGLGLAPSALVQLREVSVVFHSAATLKFDEELKKAVDLNLRSVTSLLDICDQLPHVEAFVFVSTAYSNAERAVVEERVYPAPAEPQQLLALVDAAPPRLLADITPRYIAPKPNTYTFTKAMAECAVEKHGCQRYPVAIFRPTIVISSVRHPHPGWIENLNGPSGVVVGAGKGLLHVFCCREDARADMLPVDIAIDTLLAVAWELALDRPRQVVVYNCSTSENPTTWARFELGLRRGLHRHPLDGALWYPCGTLVQNRYVLKAYELLLQTLPLHLAQYAARLLGLSTKVNLIAASRKLSAMNEALCYFSMREWQFRGERVRALRARLSPQDAALYNLDPNTINWDEHFLHFVMGVRKYVLKERDQDIEHAKRHLRRMYVLHTGLKLVSAAVCLRLVLRSTAARALLHGLLRLLLTLFHSLLCIRVAPA